MNVALLALGAFLVGTAELAVAGVIQVIAEELQISIGLAGQLISAYSLAFSIGTPILIALTSRVGRKPLLSYSLAVFLLGCLLTVAASDYVLLVLSRVILGLSAGVYTVVAISSVAKLVPPGKMGSAIGMIALGFGSAMALGVPIGIAITEWWGWRAIFALLGGVTLLVVLCLIRLLPGIEGDARMPLLRQFTSLRNAVIVSGLFISFLMCASNAVLLTYLTPYLQTMLHMDVTATVSVMTVLGIIGMIASRLGGWGVDRWGAVRMLGGSLAIGALALVALPPVASVTALALVLMSVWMFTVFTGAPALQTYFIQQAPQASNAVLSLNMSVVHLGLAAGAGTGGAVIDAAASPALNPWIAGAALAAGLGVAILSFSLRKTNRRSLA